MSIKMKQLVYMYVYIFFLVIFSQVCVSNINNNYYDNQRIECSVAEYIKKNFPVIFSGYIKNELFFDTRQVVGQDGDQILLFPEKKFLIQMVRILMQKVREI